MNTEYDRIYFSCAYVPQSKKGGKKIKDCFNMTERTNRTIIHFNTLNINQQYLLVKYSVVQAGHLMTTP